MASSDRATPEPRRDRPASGEAPGPEERAVYIISVAAELAGVHPQTLRIYERKGLLQPHRTSGNTRRYSQRDIERLREIQDLTQEQGINLAGVKAIIELQSEIDELRAAAEELQRQLRVSRRAAQKAIRQRGAASSQIVPIRNVFLPPWEGPRR
jgi:MerR family transcriptional regulator/heat shock protein HspR